MSGLLDIYTMTGLAVCLKMQWSHDLNLDIKRMIALKNHQLFVMVEYLSREAGKKRQAERRYQYLRTIHNLLSFSLISLVNRRSLRWTAIYSFTKSSPSKSCITGLFSRAVILSSIDSGNLTIG